MSKCLKIYQKVNDDTTHIKLKEAIFSFSLFISTGQYLTVYRATWHLMMSFKPFNSIKRAVEFLSITALPDKVQTHRTKSATKPSHKYQKSPPKHHTTPNFVQNMHQICTKLKNLGMKDENADDTINQAMKKQNSERK